jgi:hypothetical protein
MSMPPGYKGCWQNNIYADSNNFLWVLLSHGWQKNYQTGQRRATNNFEKKTIFHWPKLR